MTSRGVLAKLVSLCAATFTITAFTADVYPYPPIYPYQNEPVEKRPITFRDVADGQYSARTFSPDWISENEYLMIGDMDGDYNDEFFIRKLVDLEPDMNVDPYGNYLMPEDKFYASAEKLDWYSGYDSVFKYSSDMKFIAYRKTGSKNKKWRYSYEASWDVFVFGGEFDGTLVTSLDDIQYLEFSPEKNSVDGWTRFVYLKGNDLYLQKIGLNSNNETTTIPAIPITTNGEAERIFNGKPDWVYEEEVIGDAKMFYWSSNGKYLAYTMLDDTNVKHIEFQTYGSSSKTYPDMTDIAYPKPGTVNPIPTVFCVDIEQTLENESASETKVEFDLPKEELGDVDYVFYNIDWFKQSDRIIVWWMNRIQNESIPVWHDIEDAEFGSGNLLNYTILAASGEKSETGWVGLHGPVPIRLMESTDEYFFQIKAKDGFQHVHLIFPFGNPDRDNMEDFVTDPDCVALTLGNVTVTSILGARPNESTGKTVVVFQAAAGSAKDRNLYSIEWVQDCHGTYTVYDFDEDEWYCHSCKKCSWLGAATKECDNELRAQYDITVLNREECLYATASSYSIEKSDYLSVSCYGPDIPSTIITKFTKSGHAFQTEFYKYEVEDNLKLVNNLEELELPTVQYGKFPSKTGFEFQYEIWTPYKFQELNKLHPIIVEIYGGPTSQAVKSRWGFGLSSHYATSNCEDSGCAHAIHVKLDGRGSGNAGDELMHSVYEKLGWYEKVDITEFVRALVFSESDLGWLNPVAGRVNPDQVGIWGWSYGGFATTHTMAFGDDVWKCGVSVAALNSRLYYDSIYTEMAENTPQNNPNGYSNGTITEMDLSNFHKVKFTMIHGTADDNVHFHNGAMISKALINEGIEFNNYFYGDEAHSINYGLNSKDHVNKLIFRKMNECFQGKL